MSGFLNGKTIKSNSINVFDKLDEQNHTTDMSDGKSIVNVEALNSAISSSGGGGDVTNGTNLGTNEVNVFKTKNGSVLEFKGISSDNNIDLSETTDSIQVGVNLSNLGDNLQIPDGLGLSGTTLQLLDGTTVIDTVDLTPAIVAYLTANICDVCDLIDQNCGFYNTSSQGMGCL